MNKSNHSPNSSVEVEKMKVLIIDDEPANIALLEEILVENGYSRFKSVVDSKLAVDVCKSFQPDLVLLDLMMPPPDGFAILEALRSDTEENFVQVLVLTVHTNDQTQ